MTNIITNPVPKPKHGTVVVDWSPRICGATAWGGHLRGADPKIELLSFSKSGRPLASWESAFDWQARKIADAADILNDYDTVILGDIACFAPDVPLSDNGRPYYEDVMRRVTNKWTAVFHGGTYPTKHDETIDAVLSSPGFCGMLVVPRIGQAKTRLAKWPGLRFAHHPYLPYDMSHAPARRGIKGRTKSVMMTARLMSNKGQNAALVLADHLKGDTEIWGYNPFGFPSIAWSLWELGSRGLGYTPISEPILRADKLSLTHPNAPKFYTGKFEFQTPTGRHFRYHDGYRTLDEIDWSPWVHLSLASPDFAGILEYTIIDAVMSGAIVAVPESFPTEGKYSTVITFPFEGSTITWNDQKKVIRDKRPFDIKSVQTVVNGLLSQSHQRLAEIQDTQYNEFRQLHDPKKTLNAVRRALKGTNDMPKFTTPSTTAAQPPPKPVATRGRPPATPSGIRPSGGVSLAPADGEKSGAFIRRCLQAGMGDDDILAVVHAHFEGSKASKSDISWNKQKLRKLGEDNALTVSHLKRVEAPRPEPSAKVQKVAAGLPPWEGKNTKIETPKMKILPQTLLATLNQAIRNLQFLVDNLGE